MFWNKNKKEVQKLKHLELLNIISSTFVKGDIKTKQPVRIDGQVSLNIDSDNRIVIGENAIFSGLIKCRSLLVLGKIEGKIFAKEHVELGDQAFVKGNILTKKIHISDGAKLEGFYKIIEDEKSVIIN